MDNGTTVMNGEAIRRLAFHAASSALNRMQHQYQGFAQYPYQERLHNAQENFVGILPVLRQLIYYMFVGTILLMTSMATYALFYLVAMPTLAATEPLYFDYACKNTLDGLANACPDETTNCEYRHSCSPTAIVDIFAKATPWEALHPDVVPDARSKTRILTLRKHYFLDVVLQLPETTTNQQIGMFAIEVELQSKNHVPLARSHRSSRLPHESGWISVVRKSICLVPLLVGALSESRTVIIPSFRHFVESANHPLQHVVVKLVSQGQSWQGDRPIEAIAGEVRIGKELNAFQNILKEWFWSSFMVGTLLIFTFQSFLFCMANFMWDSWKAGLRRRREEEIDLGDAPYFFDATPPQSAGGPFVDDGDQWEAMPPQDDHDSVPHNVDEPEMQQ